jgi:uncharacterized membrane protein
MTWNRWYGLKSYVKSALWIVPLLAVALEMAMTRVVHRIGIWLHATTGFLELSMAGAQVLLQTIITMTLSFTVFTFGSLLVAIQVASGQYTPRIIATTLLRDNAIRYTVGLFIFTMLFALKALNRMDTTVHQFSTWVAALFGLVSLVAFLFLIDYAARLLRPISLVDRIGKQGIAVLEDVYPNVIKDPHDTIPSQQEIGRPPDRVVNHRGKSAIILAVNLEALVTAARTWNGIIEFVPYVGDFVAGGEPLFRLYGGTSAIDEGKLQGAVAFGAERTIEQDATFAFRVLVDIAIKALSKAINDPTTAVVAIDQLHRLLRVVGQRHLRVEQIRDGTGQVRVIFRTPNWEDFVHLAFSEIRYYGAENIQIARRLRAMIENLMKTLPEFRHTALREQLDLLDRTIEKIYVIPEDLALARVADSQGLGAVS